MRVVGGRAGHGRWPAKWAVFSLLALAAASDAATFYGGSEGGPIMGLVREWQRPTAEGFEAARYERTNFFVTETGVYRFSHRTIAPDHGSQSLPRAIYLYADGFDPERPRLHLMSQADGSSGEEEFEFSAFLAADVKYTFVVSTVDPVPANFGWFEFRMSVTGPGRVRQGHCRLADETAGDHVESPYPEAALDFPHPSSLHGTLCVLVDFSDGDGVRRSAQLARSRTEDSVFFTFFDENNLEVQVKLVDGCAVNERNWVLISASTDRSFEVVIIDKGYDKLDRSSAYFEGNEDELGLLRYTFPGGPAESIVDVGSVRCGY